MSLEPLFFAKVTTEACTCDVRMNDCPLVTDEECGAVEVEQAVNRWVHAGVNAIEVTVGPCEGETSFRPGARVEVALRVEEKGPGKGMALGRAVLRRASEGEGLETDRGGTVGPGAVAPLGEGRYRARWEVGLEVPFGRQVWEDAPEIPADTRTVEELTARMKELWEILRRKDMEAALAFFRERDADLARVHYQDVAVQVQATRAAIEGWWMMEANGMPLQDFFGEDLAVFRYGYGRLATVLLPEFLGSPIVYAPDDFSVVNMIMVYFYRHPARGWIPIR